jgi:acyl-CoA synthetase (NDP forming)
VTGGEPRPIGSFGRIAASGSNGDWYEHLVAPRSVAVVGASADPAKGSLLRNVLRLGFSGEVVPVNPHGGTIEGLRVARTLAEVERRIDLALIAVPAALVPGAVRECAHAGVSVGYIMTAGFAELGPQGAALEREASAAAAETGMRLLGPNSNGMISARAGLAASIMTTVSDLEAPLIDGGVAVISQSGAVGTFILTACLEAGVSVGTYFSTGNECDVGFEEILDRLVDDPGVKVVLAYIEGLRNGADFVSAAARAQESGKPLVVLKVGVTEEGATASASHTAAMAGTEVVYDGVLRQLGVRRASNLSELVHAGVVLSSDRRVGPRLAVITISGGLAVMATDEAVPRSLRLPAWAPSTARQLEELLPKYVTVRNPLDTSGVIADDPLLLRTVLNAAATEDGVDVLLLALGGSQARRTMIVEALVSAGPGLAKPLVVVWVGETDESTRRLIAAGVPCFGRLEDAVSALALSVGPQRREVDRANVQGASPTSSRSLTAEEDPSKIALALVAEARHHERLTLDEFESKAILRAFGIPCVPEATVQGVDEVGVAAADLCYPLVAKLRSPGLLHKSDVGGVLLGLADRNAVERAVAELLTRAHQLGLDDADVLLQEQIPVGVELLLGSSTDPTFGPVLSLGIGGVAAEIAPDLGVRLPHLSADDVEQLLSRLRSQRLLDGFRGAAAVSRAAVADVAVRFGEMVEDLAPWVKEIDVNPLVSRRDNGRLVVVDALMVLR